MKIIGLTGSIGMGKSFVARAFVRLGAALFDADKEVHKLLSAGGNAVDEVAKTFPAAKSSNYIDRRKLAQIVYKDQKELLQLEAILHKKIRLLELQFIKLCFYQRRNIVVMDIPLLFETGFDRYCDAVVVVTAPEFIQKQRVLGKRKLPREIFNSIKDRQLSEHEKTKRADYVINTGLEKGKTLRKVQQIFCDSLLNQ